MTKKLLSHMLSAMGFVALGTGAMVGAAAFTGSAGAQDTQQSDPQSTPQTDWTKRVIISEIGGHIVGNPLARKRLVEYVSYSCPHCASYAKDSAAAIESRYISKGSVSVEVRSFVRNQFDYAAALLARCGPPAKFIGNHRAILAQQPQWLARAGSPDPIAQQRWRTADTGKRLQYIASDIGLRALMQKRGFSDAMIDQCLADEVAQNKLVEMSRFAINTVKIEGTPAFTLNDKYLAKTHSWRALEPKLRSAFGGL